MPGAVSVELRQEAVRLLERSGKSGPAARLRARGAITRVHLGRSLRAACMTQVASDRNQRFRNQVASEPAHRVEKTCADEHSSGTDPKAAP